MWALAEAVRASGLLRLEVVDGIVQPNQLGGFSQLHMAGFLDFDKRLPSTSVLLRETLGETPACGAIPCFVLSQSKGSSRQKRKHSKSQPCL